MNEPTFRFSRESRIRIDADGHVWHEGERISHPRLESALASWVDYDDDAGRYVLRNALDWCFVTVDHCPLVVRAVHRRDGARFDLDLSDGSTEALDPHTLRVAPDGRVYAYVRVKPLVCLFDRVAAFTLLEHATLGPDGAPSLDGVALKTLSPGEVPPPRPPAQTPDARASQP